MSTTKQTVRLTVECDFSKATVGPPQVMRWLLKRIGRVFNVKCTKHRTDVLGGGR